MSRKTTEVDFEMNKQYRSVVFTIYENDEGDLKYWENKLKEWKGVTYCIYGRETCPTTGRPHLQGCVDFRSPKYGRTLKNWNKTAHWERRKGSYESNEIYCSKERDYVEWGEPHEQGKRNDLLDIAESVKRGELTADDVAMEYPWLYHGYGRTLHKIEDITLRHKFRTWMTKGIWLFGGTGTGKTHRAYMDYCSLNPRETYRFKDDKGWQDGYTGQKYVIINEFRGKISYGELMDIVDKWPYELSRRAREPVPFLAELVVITSPMPPEEVFHNLAKRDSLKQLYRRFEVIECLSQTETRLHKWSEGNTEALTTSEHF